MTSVEEVRPRGRPRPQETIDRDIRILKHLRSEGARTRNQLAEDLGLSKTKTYLALDRLRRQGLVRTCTTPAKPVPEDVVPVESVNGDEGPKRELRKDIVWSSDVEAPCP